MDPKSVVDVYINVVIALTVDVDDNVDRMEGLTLHAFDRIACPQHKNKLLPREEMESHNKLEAEASLEKGMMVLGWIFISISSLCLFQQTNSMCGQRI